MNLRECLIEAGTVDDTAQLMLLCRDDNWKFIKNPTLEKVYEVTQNLSHNMFTINHNHDPINSIMTWAELTFGINSSSKIVVDKNYIDEHPHCGTEFLMEYVDHTAHPILLAQLGSLTSDYVKSFKHLLGVEITTNSGRTSNVGSIFHLNGFPPMVVDLHDKTHEINSLRFTLEDGRLVNYSSYTLATWCALHKI